MTDIEVYISVLDKKEHTAFCQYLAGRNKRSDAKNISLFRSIIQGRSDEIKSQMTANAYHVLKKRLTDRLQEFTAGCIIESEQTAPVEIMRILVLGQKLFKLKHFKTAFKLLRKAEAKARENSDFHLLNEIYQTYIQYSYHDLSPDQSELFDAYEKNEKAYANAAHLNMVYALVRKAFQNQERNQTPLDLDKLIKESFRSFGITDTNGYTFQTLNQIAEIADISGSHKRNYFEIDLFFEQHLETMQGSQLDTEKQLPYHIKLLYHLAHIYFRKKDFKKSIQYLFSMAHQMARHDKKYFAFYKNRHATLLALNYNFIGNAQKAGEILDQLDPKKGKVNFRDRNLLQAIISRAVIHFQQGEFTAAKKKMTLLWQQDNVYIDNMGLEWLINKKFIEILIAIELGNTGQVDSLIASLIRKRKAYFTGANYLALPFLKLIETYHKKPEYVITEAFEKKVESTFDWKPAEEEDLFFMSYYAWLKSKMKRKPLYEMTLELIDSARI